MMAPPRSVRDEVLSLHKPGQPDVALFKAREFAYEFDFPTQRRFKASPNARVLAYTTPGDSKLTLLRRDGATTTVRGIERDEFRFSPDGQMLAFVRWRDSARRIERMDLKSFSVEPWTDISSVIWMEFSVEGLVVLHYGKPGADEHLMTLIPWSGEPRLLARVDRGASRFIASMGSKRIVYFISGHAWSIREPGAEPKRIVSFRGPVTNAEMSPDGHALIVASHEEAYLLEGDEVKERFDMPHINTIWFSRDGNEFVIANNAKARWCSGSTVREVFNEQDAPIRGARFMPGAPGLVVARGKDALRWNPERDEVDVLASAGEDREMLGADICSGGVVLWTGGRWSREKRKGRSANFD